MEDTISIKNESKQHVSDQFNKFVILLCTIIFLILIYSYVHLKTFIVFQNLSDPGDHQLNKYTISERIVLVKKEC